MEEGTGRACRRTRLVQEDRHVPNRQPWEGGSIQSRGRLGADLAGWACHEDRGHGWGRARGGREVQVGPEPRLQVEDEPSKTTFVSTEFQTVMMSRVREDDV